MTAFSVAPWPKARVDDAALTDEVIALWRACGLTRPWNDPAADMALALRSPASTILLAWAGERVIGTVMVGHDGHRGAVYYLAAAPDLGRRGIGRALMEAAEAWLSARDVPKLNLMVRTENADVAAFYRRLGYGRDDVMVLSKRFAPSPQS